MSIESLLDQDEIFPNMEGSDFEFKLSFNNYRTSKIMETLCGFLNNDGGHMIFGIDDKTRKIVGLTMPDKKIDDFILTIDRVYHVKAILAQETMDPVPPGLIVVKAFITKLNKKVVYITVKKSDSGLQFMLKDGTIVYRANASNYIIKAEHVYSEVEHKAAIKQVTNKHTKMLKEITRNFNLETERMRAALHERNVLEELLTAKILQEKQSSELNLTVARQQEFNLFSFLMPCLK